MPTRLPTHHIPGPVCPVCADPLELHANVSGEAGQPEDGDLTICIGCASILQFRGAPLALHAMTAQEVAGLPADVRRPLLHAQLSARIAIELHPRPKPTAH